MGPSLCPELPAGDLRANDPQTIAPGEPQVVEYDAQERFARSTTCFPIVKKLPALRHVHIGAFYAIA